MEKLVAGWRNPVGFFNYNRCVIILKESIRFRAATKRTAYTKDKLL